MQSCRKERGICWNSEKSNRKFSIDWHSSSELYFICIMFKFSERFLSHIGNFKLKLLYCIITRFDDQLITIWLYLYLQTIVYLPYVWNYIGHFLGTTSKSSHLKLLSSHGCSNQFQAGTDFTWCTLRKLCAFMYIQSPDVEVWTLKRQLMISRN